MKSKSVFGIFLISVVLYLGASFALAEVADKSESVEIEDAGITPDNLFYFADSFGESFRLAITFNKEKEIKLRLKYAEEKLSEANEMAKKGKIEKIEKSQRKHLENLEKAKEDFDELEFKSEVERFEREIEFESELQNHEKKIEAVEQNIKIKIKGDLTAEQSELIEKLIASFGDDTKNLKIEIKEKRGETKIKIEEKGLDSDEFEDKFEEKHGYKANLQEVQDKMDDAKEEILKAEIEIEKAKEEGKETEAAEKRLEDAMFKLEQAVDMFWKENYQAAYSLAKNAEKFAKQARMKFLGKTIAEIGDDFEDVSDAAGNSGSDDEDDGDDDDTTGNSGEHGDDDNSGSGNGGSNSGSGGN